MELPDRIENFTKEQLMHLDMLVDQLDEAYPLDRTDEERLAKDPHLAILPSGMKLSTKGVRCFEIIDQDEFNRSMVGTFPPTFRPGNALIRYDNCGEEFLSDPHDIAAFDSALNDIGVYVAAPTLKGDDADGDGQIGEHHLNAVLGEPV